MNECYNIDVVVKVTTAVRGGVSIREKRSSSRSRRGGVSKNWTEGATAARLFFLTAVAIAIATRPFKYSPTQGGKTRHDFRLAWLEVVMSTNERNHKRFDIEA